MSDSSRIVETLKAKAMLLIQREREVYALRLGRERMLAWLQAFHRLSMKVRSGAGASICAEWAELMIAELHFQTAAAFRHDVATGELSLIHGQSHAPLPEKLALDERARRVLRERREGLFDRSEDPNVVALARTLRLQTFLWLVFPDAKGQEIVLVAGIAASVAAAQGALSNDDLVYFTMLGRHLAVLFTNAALIADLGSATRNLQELFDHMRQAIVAFDATGSIGSVSSRQAKLIFEQENLEGCLVRDLLYRGAPPYDVDAAAFGDWLELAMSTPPSEWASCEAYAPRDVVVTHANGSSIPLALEFRPLVRDERITHLMMLATDVTMERKLEKAVRTHEAEHGRRVAAMRRVIAGGTQVFLDFLDSARARLERCDALLQGHPSARPIEVIDEVFRQAHTIRSEARAFDLAELEEATHMLEADLDRIRTEARGEEHSDSVGGASLLAGVHRARQALERGRDVLAAASPAGTAVFDQVTVPRSALRMLAEYVTNGPEPLAQLVKRLFAVPFGVAAAGVVDSVAAWAASDGKTVAVHIEPRELLIPGPLARALPGVLAHLVRNAIAHGIEPADERRAAGKPEQGTIRIAARESEHGVRVTVEDDGRGLNVARILEQARGVARGADAAEVVFLPGVTTRDVPDSLAGHGVGLDAVRRELACVHYEVFVSFAPEKWTRVTLAPRDAPGGDRLEVQR
ncbi:MAG TPA: ATP-binding protein [Polyangiaceae bacterium]|nr:ATP-binding protein [Polyangiaceae bacterium]